MAFVPDEDPPCSWAISTFPPKPAKEVIHRTMKFLDVSLDDAALERVRFFV